MAYISQNEKKEKLAKLKPLFNKYGIRATLSIHHLSTLNLNIWESSIDFMGQYNNYRLKNPNEFSRFENVNKPLKEVKLYTGAGRSMDFEEFEGDARKFLLEANKILQEGNFDNSDSMTDYFHVGFYSAINIGNYERDFIFNPEYKKPVKTQVEKVDVEGFKLIDYSNKAIALFGDTKPLKDKLKELGGRFNPFLKLDGEKMAGWIFKKELEQDLKLLIGA